ncbi:MAG: guanylate kinase [Nitrospinota bacterium]
MAGSKRQGLLFVVSSPSGGGKTSLVNQAVESLSNLTRSISCTTRPPRARERDHVDYIFLNRAEFERRIAEDHFLEWAEVYGNLYGTPKEPIGRNRARGVDTILAIEIQGARSVRRKYPEAITIFLQPPSLELLEQRLRERSSDPEEVIQNRLELARSEMDWNDHYEYIIVNDRLDKAVEDLKAIIMSERRRARRHRDPHPA